MRVLPLSESHANLAYNVSNIILILGAVLALLGTVGAIWSGSIRERYADERAQESEEKVANALSEAAKANERNTRLQIRLEQERKERLELEEKVSPRRLSMIQQRELSERLRKKTWTEAEIIWHGGAESEGYAKDILSAFQEAGLNVKIHTLGPFIPSAWGLMVIQTHNGDAESIKEIFEEALVEIEIAQTNETIGLRAHPLIFVGNKDRGEV